MNLSVSARRWQRAADELAVRLATVRRARRVAQVDLAEAAGLARSHVQVIEYGRCCDRVTPANPRLRSVYEIARVLGVRPSALLPAVDVVPGCLPEEMPLTEEAVVASVLAAVEERSLPLATRVSLRMPVG